MLNDLAGGDAEEPYNRQRSWPCLSAGCPGTDEGLRVRLTGAAEASLDGQRVADLELRKSFNPLPPRLFFIAQKNLLLETSQRLPFPKAKHLAADHIVGGGARCCLGCSGGDLPKAAASANLRRTNPESARKCSRLPVRGASRSCVLRQTCWQFTQNDLRASVAVFGAAVYRANQDQGASRLRFW
jgi:hypothetical protein